MGHNIFKQRKDGNYEIVDQLKTDEEIDRETFGKIKEKYPDNPHSGLTIESKMLRLGVLNKTDVRFVEYCEHVDNCITNGQQKKDNIHIKLVQLREIELPDSMGVKILVRE